MGLCIRESIRMPGLVHQIGPERLHETVLASRITTLSFHQMSVLDEPRIRMMFTVLRERQMQLHTSTFSGKWQSKFPVWCTCVIFGNSLEILCGFEIEIGIVLSKWKCYIFVKTSLIQYTSSYLVFLVLWSPSTAWRKCFRADLYIVFWEMFK